MLCCHRDSIRGIVSPRVILEQSSGETTCSECQSVGRKEWTDEMEDMRGEPEMTKLMLGLVTQCVSVSIRNCQQDPGFDVCT